MTRRTLAAIVALTSACGGPGSRLGGAARDCEVGVTGMRAVEARCFEAPDARALAIRADARGDVIVAGVFERQLTFDRITLAAPERTVHQPFVARLAADLAPRWAIPLGTPGLLRGVAVGPSGITVVSSGIEDARREGPFLMRIGEGGRVMMGRDLAFGGLVTDVTTDGSGSLVLRAQREGVRVVVSDPEGNVRFAPEIASSVVPQFPSSLAENGLVSELAVGQDGTYAIVARGPSEDGLVSDRALVKVSPAGAVLFTRPVPVSGATQIVAYGGAVAVLTPDARALCPGRESFAITSLDTSGAPRWLRCVPVHATGLRIASAPGRLAVSGVFKGRVDLGTGALDAGVGIASFVMTLDDRGGTRHAAILANASTVLVQALAMTEETIFVAAAVALGNAQTHLFVAALRD